MKVYSLEIMVIDFDNVGLEGIKDTIENTRYPNRCISPQVIGHKEADIGEWSDNHPLNMIDGQFAEYKKLFNNI